jgi:hypothetical protein
MVLAIKRGVKQFADSTSPGIPVYIPRESDAVIILLSDGMDKGIITKNIECLGARCCGRFGCNE